MILLDTHVLIWWLNNPTLPPHPESPVRQDRDEGVKNKNVPLTKPHPEGWGGLLPISVAKEITKYQKTGSICLSAVSIWEVCLLVQKNKLSLQRNLNEWTERLEKFPFLKIIPVNHWLFLRSTELPLPFHADPADRIIVATALNLGATLITKDQKILSYPYVKTFWSDS